MGRCSREAAWLVPFVCVGLVVLALLRPEPRFATAGPVRNVVDGEGSPVAIAQPFQGAVFTWGPGLGADTLLEAALAPEQLASAGTAEDREGFAQGIWSRIFPAMLHDDRLWNEPSLGFRRGAVLQQEHVMAMDAGVFFGGRFGPARLLRQVGIPTLYFESAGQWEDYQAAAARLITKVVGHSDRAEALVAQNRKAYASLFAERGAVPVEEQARVLVMGTASPYYVKVVNNSYQAYLEHAEVRNATRGLTAQQQDAERILSMDPDFIFLMARGSSPQEFMADPLWRGLKAVQARRVYRTFGKGGGGLPSLTDAPVLVRWMDEIVYPDRLAPATRQRLRDRYVPRFGYRMSDAEIDADLHVDVNLGSAGYDRFTQETESRRD
ncbi:MAG: ABC transporter substrate-binding protein [Gammaproteobacteria bacterium]